jgi:hypothetical protein
MEPIAKIGIRDVELILGGKELETFRMNLSLSGCHVVPPDLGLTLQTLGFFERGNTASGLLLGIVNFKNTGQLR